jgi:hypothetical protein
MEGLKDPLGNQEGLPDARRGHPSTEDGYTKLWKAS